MNNKGFTLIEVVMTIAIGVVLFLSVLFIPVNISKQNLIIRQDLNENLNTSSILNTFSLDLYTLEKIEIDGNKLHLSDKQYYEFREEGLYRVGVNESIKISNKNLSFHVDSKENYIKIYEDIDNDEKFELYFPLRGLNYE